MKGRVSFSRSKERSPVEGADDVLTQICICESHDDCPYFSCKKYYKIELQIFNKYIPGDAKRNKLTFVTSPFPQFLKNLTTRNSTS